MKKYLIMLFAGCAVLAGGSAAANPTITDISLITKKRIGQSVSEYTYKVTIINDNLPRQNVSATLVNAGQNITIIDGNINVGLLAPNQVIALFCQSGN